MVHEDAEVFVDRCRAYWAQPRLEDLAGLLQEDIVLEQPLWPKAIGLRAARSQYARLLHLVPDVHGTVETWSARGDVVFVEMRLRGTLGGKPLEWVQVDRFRLYAGKARERASYFDALALLWRLALSPNAWPRLLSYEAELRARLEP